MNVLLYRALLICAQQIESDKPDIVIGAYNEALKRAKDCKIFFFFLIIANNIFLLIILSYNSPS